MQGRLRRQGQVRRPGVARQRGNTQQVRATNIDAGLSKWSAVKAGYFADPFLEPLLRYADRARREVGGGALRRGRGDADPLAVRRSPLINRGYFARVCAFDSILRSFARRAGERGCQIVNLGAGSDTLYFRVLSDPTLADRVRCVVDVDFPDTIRNKMQAILATPSLAELVDVDGKSLAAITASNAPERGDLLSRMRGEEGGTAVTGELEAGGRNSKSSQSSNCKKKDGNLENSQSSKGTDDKSETFQFHGDRYGLVGVNMANLDALRTILEKSCLERDRPTLVVAECVLVYMSPEESAPLIQFLADFLTGGAVFASYEQIGPNDAFGVVMLRNLEERGCALRGIRAHPDADAQRNRFLSLGWDACQVKNMNEVYSQTLPRAEVQRAEKLEMFDEFEEWNLMQAHYCISLAVKEAPGFQSDVWDGIGFLSAPSHQSVADEDAPPPEPAQRIASGEQ